MKTLNENQIVLELLNDLQRYMSEMKAVSDTEMNEHFIIPRVNECQKFLTELKKQKITIKEETTGNEGWFFVTKDGITLQSFMYNENYVAEGRNIELWSRQNNLNKAKELFNKLRTPAETITTILFEEEITNK